MFHLFPWRFCLLLPVLALLTLSVWAEPMPALVSREGTLTIRQEDQAPLLELAPALFDAGWQLKHGVAAPASMAGQPSLRPFQLQAAGGALVRGSVEFAGTPGGTVSAKYVFIPDRDLTPDCLYVGASWPVSKLMGGRWEADVDGRLRHGSFPAQFGEMVLFSGTATRLKLQFAGAESLEFQFPEKLQVYLQDDRRWGSSISLRLMPVQGGGGHFAAGSRRTLAMEIASQPVSRLEFDQPVTLAAGPDWIPCQGASEIVAGSALDFSGPIQAEAPAGQHGRIVVNSAGHFAFADQPEQSRRFRGVNLCFSAQYLPHDQADRLADRLVRLGYNALRIHHYEGALLNGRPGPADFDPQRLDQLDYLLAACIRRGLYITTDLYVSRPVTWKELGADKPGNLAMDEFKMLVPVMPAARNNWKQFARALLTHRNPYTGKTYAEEPALAWLSLINEGNFGNFHSIAQESPEWRRAWNQWLRQIYPDRAALVHAWGDFPVPAAWPQEEMAIPDPQKASSAARDWWRFLAATDQEMTRDLKKFLRDELKCQALVTNGNAWTNHPTDQATRTLYDYVDDHHYFDHPQFLEKPWRLPSRCGHVRVPDALAEHGLDACFTRLLDRPFTLSEFNVAAPGRHRHSSGLALYALAARQDWDVLWRFAFSHSDRNLFEDTPAINYFDLVADPVNLAADRAGFFLFQRGDLAPLAATIAIGMTSADLDQPPLAIPRLPPDWGGAAWLARLGCLVGEPQRWQNRPGGWVAPVGWRTPAAAWGPRQAGFSPYAGGAEAVRQCLARDGRGQDDGATHLDPRQHAMVIDTPCTAGGTASAGQSLASRDGRWQFEVRQADATAWISSLDGQSLGKSRHLLLTHLTEAQNQGARFAESARSTLLDWGKGPPLARRGQVLVKLRLEEAAQATVYALAASGVRLGTIPSRLEQGVLAFEADTAGGGNGAPARLLYEIVVEPGRP